MAEVSDSRPIVGYKANLLDRLFGEFDGEPARVLDLGCGRCASVVGALRRHPNVAYTGVEQSAAALAEARRTVGAIPSVELHEGFGEDFAGGGFDLVLSLSVLEHVKHLDDFLRVSVEAARPGGRIVHRYDLGHALTPSTAGERLRVAVAMRRPELVPASRFTTYPKLDDVVGTLERLGVRDLHVVQSQMPSLKRVMNAIGDREDEEATRLSSMVLELEDAAWRALGSRLQGEERDRLFPAVMISGRRAGGDA